MVIPVSGYVFQVSPWRFVSASASSSAAFDYGLGSFWNNKLAQTAAVTPTDGMADALLLKLCIV